MRIEPKTQHEIEEGNLFPAGEYDFEITDAIETVSKSSGNEMIALRLKVFNGVGRFILVSDYLLESVAYKLRHCCEACGIIEVYETGNLDAIDFQGRSGRLKLRIDEDKSGQYAKKNSVADYIAGGSGSGAATRAPAKPGSKAHKSDLNDEIPF